jgi:hypothetical protein
MAKLNDVSGSSVEDKTATHLENSSHPSSISNETKQFILERHGTLELDPLPSDSREDPLNWPIWKKDMQLLMVAFHAMVNTFMAAGIIPGFHDFSVKYGTTIEQASYLTSVQVLCSPNYNNSMLRVNLHSRYYSSAYFPSCGIQ